MSLKSPLGRVLGLGAAKDGVSHWWWQRVTAVGVLILGLWLAYSLIALDELSYVGVTRWLATPTNAVLMLLLVPVVAYHSKLGVQVVIEDYVHEGRVKVPALVASTFFHAVLAVAGMFAVLRVSFGVMP